MADIPHINCLFVDDDPQIIALLHSVLEWHWGRDTLSMTFCVDSRDAHEHLVQHSYDLLMTDIDMPGMCGMSLLETCRSQNPWTQVIMISAHSDFSLLNEAAAGGAGDYILKPFTRHELIERIEIAMERITRWRAVLTTAVAQQWSR